VIDTLVNGHVVDTRARGAERGWRTVTVTVPASVLATPTNTISLRLRATAEVSDQHLSVWLDNVTFSGGAVADPGFESSSGSPWDVVGEGAEGQAADVQSLQFLFMTYAIYLSAEGQAQPGYYVTADYVQTVVSDAMQLTEEGIADGSLVYKLILTGQPGTGYDPDSYNRVAAVYEAYQEAHPPAECDQVITGAHDGSLVVQSGTSCLEKAAVSGSVVAQGGSRVIIDASDISGSIVAQSVTALDVCGSHVHGSVTSRYGGSVAVGAGARQCQPDVVDDSVVIGSTQSGVSVERGIVGGSVVLQGNQQGTAASGNRVSGSLVCSGNQPAVVDNGEANTVSGSRIRQCAQL
jgi:hypothetical protein